MWSIIKILKVPIITCHKKEYIRIRKFTILNNSQTQLIIQQL